MLEIGADCGALTGLLCQKARHVTSVELTEKRAQINFLRHRQWENLEIVVGDFTSIPITRKYDCVIINGVLEYAAYMLHTSDPYMDFLMRAAGMLRPRGRLLLAIENRLGLKYFSGSREDHTGAFFSGLNGYVDRPELRTFSKQELCDLLQRAALRPQVFFYPYPDYKFPAEIFTDATVNSILPNATDYPLDMNRAKLFDVDRVRKSLMDAGIADQFANSFLVECVMDDQNTTNCNISFVKTSANRHPQYRIATTIDSERTTVRKSALSEQSIAHVRRMGTFAGHTEGRIRNIDCRMEPDALCYPFLTQPNLETLLVEDFHRGDRVHFSERITSLCQALMENRQLSLMTLSPNFAHAFGSEHCEQPLRWVSQGNVDLVASNIYPMPDGQYQVVDYEWHMDCAVPAEFILWRMLRHLELGCAMQNWLTGEEIQRLTETTPQTLELFARWDEHFCREYVGIRELYSLAHETVPIDLDKTLHHALEQSIRTSTLFWDIGDGFNDQQSMHVRVNYIDNLREVFFSSPALRTALRVRWDPHEGIPCIIDNITIETDGGIVHINAINAESSEQPYLFYTYDPQLLLMGDFSHASYIRIKFHCHERSWSDGYAAREKELAESREAATTAVSKLAHCNQQLEVTSAELTQTSQRLQIADLTLAQTSQRLQDLDFEFTVAKHQLATTQINLETVSAELMLIHNSRSWKILQFLRSVVRRIRHGE